MSMDADALQRFMAASPFINWSGMRITDADHEGETLTMTMALKAEFERAGQIVSDEHSCSCVARYSYVRVATDCRDNDGGGRSTEGD